MVVSFLMQKNVRLLLAILLLSVIFGVDLLFFSGYSRIILGILFIGYFPGYSLLKAILIKDETQNSLEAFLFHVTASVVLVSFISLALAVSPVGFSLNSILIGLLIFTDILCIVGIVRRRGKTGSGIIENKGVSRSHPYPKSKLEHAASVIFSLVILLFVGISLFAIYQPSRHEPFTEFYFSDPSQFTSGNFTIEKEEPKTISVIINNQEAVDIIYRLEVIAVTGQGMSVLLDEQNIPIKMNTVHEMDLFLDTRDLEIKALKLNLYLPGESDPHRSLEFTLPSGYLP